MGAARTLLTMDPKDPKRIFEGAALLRRMSRYGLLADDELDLDSILQLTTQKLLDRRLQTKVFKQGLALYPPCSRIDPSASHSCWLSARQRSIFQCQDCFGEAH